MKGKKRYKNLTDTDASYASPHSFCATCCTKNAALHAKLSPGMNVHCKYYNLLVKYVANHTQQRWRAGARNVAHRHDTHRWNQLADNLYVSVSHKDASQWMWQRDNNVKYYWLCHNILWDKHFEHSMSQNFFSGQTVNGKCKMTARQLKR